MGSGLRALVTETDAFWVLFEIPSHLCLKTTVCVLCHSPGPPTEASPLAAFLEICSWVVRPSFHGCCVLLQKHMFIQCLSSARNWDLPTICQPEVLCSVEPCLCTLSFFGVKSQSWKGGRLLDFLQGTGHRVISQLEGCHPLVAPRAVPVGRCLTRGEHRHFPDTFGGHLYPLTSCSCFSLFLCASWSLSRSYQEFYVHVFP